MSADREQVSGEAEVVAEMRAWVEREQDASPDDRLSGGEVWAHILHWAGRLDSLRASRQERPPEPWQAARQQHETLKRAGWKCVSQEYGDVNWTHPDRGDEWYSTEAALALVGPLPADREQPEGPKDPRMASTLDSVEVCDGVRCVEMPCCGFTFAAEHVDEGTHWLYSCPLCASREQPAGLREALERAFNDPCFAALAASTRQAIKDALAAAALPEGRE